MACIYTVPIMPHHWRQYFYVLKVWFPACTTCTDYKDTTLAFWSVYNIGTFWTWLKIAGTSPCWNRSTRVFTLALWTECLLCEGLLFDPSKLCAQCRAFLRGQAAVELVHAFTGLDKDRAAWNLKIYGILLLYVIQSKNNTKPQHVFCFGELACWYSKLAKQSHTQTHTQKLEREKCNIFYFVKATI